MPPEIVINESAAHTPEAASAQVAAEAAEAAIAASHAASALAHVAAAESIAENNDAVSEIIETVENNERGLEWVSGQVEACFQNQVSQAEAMEAMGIQLSELLEIVGRIPPSIYSTPEPEALTLNGENSPLVEEVPPLVEGTIPEAHQKEEDVLPVVEVVKPEPPARRKHKPL